MSKLTIVQKFEEKQLKKNIPDFRVGDTVKVHIRIVEKEKERTQIFMGTIIARKGSGLSETFSVHRVAYGEGMERVFLLHSPLISRIEVVKHGDVKRAKLYHLRGTSGKAAKVKKLLGRREERGSADKKESEEEREIQEEMKAQDTESEAETTGMEAGEIEEKAENPSPRSNA